MKKLLTGLIMLFACISFQYATAQASDKTQRTIGYKTETIQVSGDCHMAKNIIEQTAREVRGIKSASFNEHTKTLTVKYDVFKKQATDEVQRKIAAVGFATEKYPVTDSAFEKSGCCCCNQRRAS